MPKPQGSHRPIQAAARPWAGRLRLFLALAMATALAACSSPPPTQVVHAADAAAPEVVLIRLRYSNVYLIRSHHAVLVDAGAPGDAPKILGALKAMGVEPHDLGLILLTHAHGDHAGAAAELHRLTGAPIALGAADAGMAARGRNDDLKTIGFEARLIKPFVDLRYTPFHPDIAIDAPLDLAPWGLSGQARISPGHTPGSVVVRLNDGEVFVGDMLRGGSMGGRIDPTHPHEHYFQADRRTNQRRLAELLAQGAREVYVGHGGPLTRQAIIAAFPDLTSRPIGDPAPKP